MHFSTIKGKGGKVLAGENKEKKSILQMDVSDIIKALKKKNSGKKNDKKGTKKKAKIVICKKAISIDIGSENTKIVVGRYHKNKVSIDKAFSFKTPEGSIEDGHIEDIDSLATAINDALDSNNVKNDNVIFTTNSTSIINRTIIIPKVNEDEIESVIKYEVQQYLPINLEDHMIQYNILDEKVIDGNEKLEVLIVVYPNKMVYSYYVMNPEIKESVLSIDMGAENIALTIIKDNELILIKTTKSGGNYLNSKISKVLEISLENAEMQKRENCNLMNREEGPLEHVVREVVDSWFDEASRIIKYYKSKNTQNNIDKIYLCGGSSNIKGLERYVSTKLNMKVKIVQGNSNIEFKKGVEEVNISEYINAIGALIRL